MTVDPHKYNITIRRVEVEGEVCFEARVKEFPDIFEYGDTHEEAYELAIDSIVTTADVFAEKRRGLPPPAVPPDEYSGRVTLRLPKTLHRRLAETADEECVSLNQLLVTAVAHFAGSKQYAQVHTANPRNTLVIKFSMSSEGAGTFQPQSKHLSEAPTFYDRTATNEGVLLLNQNTCEAAHG
jgi:predicted RNase H-like HicB family nuclease